MTRNRFNKVILIIGIIITTYGFVVFPRELADSARTGMSLCFETIIPSLFPFFVLSNIVIELGLARYLGRVLEPIMRPLFNLRGDCSAAFALGVIGGYPIGAKTAISLYEKKLCTKTETERMLSFCNNCGPAFILGAVGAGMFLCPQAGIILEFSHIAAAITVGLIFRFYKYQEKSDGIKLNNSFEAVHFSEAFSNSVKSALSSSLNVSAFVIFFAVVLRMLNIFGVIPALASVIGVALAPIGLDAKMVSSILTGAVEVSTGLWQLSKTGGLTAGVLAIASFMLGFAGLSVHFQTISLFGNNKVSISPYIIGKTIQGILSAVYTYIMARMFLPVIPAVAQIHKATNQHKNIIITLLFVIITLIIAFAPKKHWNKALK